MKVREVYVARTTFRPRPRDAEHLAIVDSLGSETYQQLGVRVCALGSHLRVQTRKPRVGLLLPPGAGFALGFYATLLAGKVAVPINYLLGDRPLAHVIKDSGVDTVLTAPPLAEKLRGMSLNVLDVAALPAPPTAALPPVPQPAADEAAAVLYTSGTTGLPKGVELTYGSFQSSVESVVEHGHIRGTHRSSASSPCSIPRACSPP